jgi:hypothetical protein
VGICCDNVLERRACKAVTDLATLYGELLKSCFFLKIDFLIDVLKFEIMWKSILNLFFSIELSHFPGYWDVERGKIML